MKAVILAGGQGSRLRPLTEKLPKPMVPILARPIIEHIVHHLVGFGVHDMVATLHYRPQAIRDHFGDGSEFEIDMKYTLETEPLGTAGSVKLAQRYLDETFLVVAGDALVDFDFGAFLDFHRTHRAKVSLCLTRVPDPGEFGIVITAEDGQVTRFLEKPGPSEVFSDTVNTGIYLIEPEILDQVPDRQAYDFAGDLFPALMEQGVPVFGYVAEGYWSDIGTLDQLRQAHWDMLEGKVNLPIKGNLIEAGARLGEGVDIAPDAVITGPCWFGDDVQIRKGARIGPYAALGNNVEVDRYASINRSIVMRNSFVGEASDIRNSIVAPYNIIEARCELGNDVVLGSGCRLGRAVVVKPGVLVWPDKEVDAGSTLGENLIWESLMRPSIFGSRGVSGLANLHITPEFTAALGKAFGTWVKKGRKVAISRDTHPFSRVTTRALVSGLLSVGIDVDDLEESNAPLTRFRTAHAQDVSGGIHVRIADVHPNVTLIEMYDASGLPLSRGVKRKIEATFHRADFPRVSMHQVGRLTYSGRIHERYLRQLLASVDRSALQRYASTVVYYSENERTAVMLSDLLGQAGTTHFRVGGIREQTDQERIQQIAGIARLNHAVALIIDRNAEQFQLISDVGTLLSQERAEQLLTAAFIRSGPAGDPVFLAPDHAAFLRRMAEEVGREVVLTRKDPGARLAEAREKLAGLSTWLEFSHFYLGFDAVAGVMRLLEFLGQGGLSLHNFEQQTPVSYRDTLVCRCSWEDMGRVMRELAERKEAEVGDVPEGVPLTFPEGRVYVLPSADVPQLEMTIEADEGAQLPGFVARVKREFGRLIG